MRRNILIVVLAIFSNSEAVAVDTGWGSWTDQSKNTTYSFLDDNEFIFSSTSEGKSFSRVGAWRTEEKTCWLGEQKQQVGNLMIYVDTTQCCLAATMIGQKLVITYVWDKGGYGAVGFCSNRVLNRITKGQED